MMRDATSSTSTSMARGHQHWLTTTCPSHSASPAVCGPVSSRKPGQSFTALTPKHIKAALSWLTPTSSVYLGMLFAMRIWLMLMSYGSDYKTKWNLDQTSSRKLTTTASPTKFCMSRHYTKSNLEHLKTSRSFSFLKMTNAMTHASRLYVFWKCGEQETANGLRTGLPKLWGFAANLVAQTLSLGLCSFSVLEAHPLKHLSILRWPN